MQCLVCESVTVRVTDDGGKEETLVSDPTEAVRAANIAPTGLPSISGTARVGETLTASASAVADKDGLSNATFAWQWIADDGTSDAEIAGATAETYTLTAAEAGKTVKVRVTFTDDGGREETLVSEATAQVAAMLPVVSIAAVSSPVTEGGAASFTLSRTGDTAAGLTVSVVVSEAGSVLSGVPASTVTFAAGDAEATLGVATDDDSAAEADGRVTAAIPAGTGYEVDADGVSAGVDVYDNDEAASTAVETLWTSTMTVQEVGGALLGYVFGTGLSPNGWSEDGVQFRVDSLRYFAQYRELAFTLSAGLSDPEQLTLHLDDLQVQLSGASGEKYFYWTVDHPGWQAGQTVAVKLTRADPEAAVDAGPGISVADAQVQEAEGAMLTFRVTLAEAQTSAVSVRYATSDGTAQAGLDYVSVSGALRLEAGETAKTILVPVLNDDHDDDGETMTLTLSHPFGAEIADGTATGTIRNTDPIPKAWIARFGRTVAEQVIDAVEARIQAPRVPGTELSLAGQRVRFEGGARLTPSMEIGVRHDRGDAETGFGVDIGGGLAWSDPQRGLSAEFRGRGLLTHDADGFRQRGLSGSLSWDPTPQTSRGLSLSMSQTVGAQASGGVDALFERNTFAGLAAIDDGGSGDTLPQRRFEMKLGYGLAAFGDRFTSTPEFGFGMSNSHREYSLGLRLVRNMRGDTGSLEFVVEATRREAANDNAAQPEHTAGVRIGARW